MACKYLNVVNSMTTNATAGTLTLDFVNAVSSVTDKQKFCIKIPCSMSIPTGINGYVVQVTINGASVPVWNKYGNPLTVSDLVKGKVIGGFYGATTSHVITKLPITYNCRCNNVL